MESSSHSSHGYLVLYGASGDILALNEATPPYTVQDAIGKPAWFALSGRDVEACQAAILRCVHDDEPQVIDSNVAKVGVMRTWLYPVKGLGKVRIQAVSRVIPKGILKLTAREREVCALLAAGLGSKRIAGRLRVTRSTIDNHRGKIARKIGLEPAALVAWCGEHRELF